MTPLGLVPVEGRGSLPFRLIHGESLVAAVSWALTSAGAELFDYSVPFAEVRAAGRMLVIHDPLCPLTPVAFLEQAIAECADTGAVVVGVRPVTDTVKRADGAELGATVERSALVSVCTPVAVPAAAVAALPGVDASDLPRLVEELAGRFPLRYAEAPALARRITGEDDLEVLTALSESVNRQGPPTARPGHPGDVPG